MDLSPIDWYFEQVAKHFATELGDRVESVYKIGSLAHGGFSAPFSDIDLALILSEPVDAAAIEAVTAGARAIDPELGARLSIFWSNRAFEFGRFPILDRADLIDHGVLVLGEPLPDLPRPDVEDVRAYLLGHPLEYWTEKTRRFQGATAVEPAERKEFVRCLLYPARFSYTWDRGTLASNDDAVRHLEAREERGQLDLEPVRAALACRRGEVTFDALLRFSSLLERQREETLRMTGAGDSA